MGPPLHGLQPILKYVLEEGHRLDIVVKTKRKRRADATRHMVSMLGGYQLALKRNLGHASASSLVMHLDAGVGVKPVYRWERILGANIMAQARSFYSQHHAYLKSVIEALSNPQAEAGEDTQMLLSYEVHSIRADATNSAAVHSAKAHVLELMSFYRHAAYHLRDAAGNIDAPPEEDIHRVFSDLQKVPETCTGVEQRALFIKQIQAAGCRRPGRTRSTTCNVGERGASSASRTSPLVKSEFAKRFPLSQNPPVHCRL